MYKNQRRIFKRPVAAAAAADDRDVVVAVANFQKGDTIPKSPVKGQAKDSTSHNEPPSKKKSDISKPKPHKEFSLDDSDEDQPIRVTRKSSERTKLNENTNLKKINKATTSTPKVMPDDGDKEPQRGKGKSLPVKSVNEISNSKSLTKQVTTSQKFIIDTLSSDDEEPQKGKRKSSEKKQSASPSTSKNVSALTQKGPSDHSSSTEDEEPQRGKGKSPEKKKSIENTNTENLKKLFSTAKKLVVDESSSEDEIPQRGKGKALENKITNKKSSTKVVTPAEKITIDSSSSDDETPQKRKGKSLANSMASENNRSKSSKKVISLPKKVTVDDSSSEDEIPQKGKGKAIPKRATENNKLKTSHKVITSTQKSMFDNSSSEEDVPQKGNKRTSDNANEPAAKRTQKASGVPDFPASLAVSSIFSPGNTPEKRPRLQGSPRKRTDPKNRNTGRALSDNPFFSQLRSLGFTFGDGEEPNCLDRDQASFVRSLDSALQNDKRYPQNVAEFVKHFETFMNESTDNLRKVLENTQSSDDYARKSVQECLVRLLLNVDCVQPKLWRILLAKISELVIDEEEDEANFELLHRIIRQMRCLDWVIEGEVNICDELFVISQLATKEDTKREIILLLPEVIREEDHEKAARTVSAGLTSNHALIPAYVDTLSALTLSEETRKAVVEKVIDILSRADTKYFHVIIKFLLTTADNLEPVIRGIRKHVDLDPTAYGNDGNEAIMLASTLREVENKKTLVATWLELAEEPERQEWLAVDFVALLVSYAKVKPAVTAAFKRLARRDADAERDVQKAYPAIKSIVEQDCLESVRQLLDVLFKSRVVLESRHAAFWYRFLLTRIDTCHINQNILDDVMSHIGHSMNNPAEVSLGLNCLIDASNENRDLVAKHTQRILTLIHNIEHWPLAQVRQVMNLLLSLVYHRDGASGMQDVMTIAIRKHLNHPSFTWRSKGIVGMVAQLKHMPAASALDQLKVVLDAAENFSGEARGLLYDELASACEDLDPDVSDELRNFILQAFEDTYVINLEDADGRGRVSFEIIRNDTALAVPFVGAAGGWLTMFAQLRLILRTLAVHGALEEVSALLACAVLLPDVDTADFIVLPAHRRREVVDSYFSCINYFRELVNGFSRDDESRVVVVRRLEQIVEMNKTLSVFLAVTYGYTPPQCQFYTAAKAPAIRRRKAPLGFRKGKGGKGKNQDEEMDTTNGNGFCWSSGDRKGRKGKTQDDEDDDSDDDFVGKEAAVAMDLSLYRDFFRDLDMNLFTILKCPLRCSDAEPGEVSITGETMKFLLADYAWKLESMFTVRAPSPFRKAGVPAAVVDTQRSAKYCVRLSALLRFQLDSVIDYVKELAAECDGVADAAAMFAEGTAEIKECGMLLFRCLHTLLSWPGFKYPQNAAMKEDVLARLNKKKTGTGSDNVTEGFDGLAAMADNVVLLPGAVALLKLLDELNAFDPTPRRAKTIHKTSKAFLRRTWFDVAGEPERASKRFNGCVEAVLTYFVRSLPAGHRLRHVTELVTLVEKEYPEMGDGDVLPSFPNISKSNFHSMYKILCVSVGDVVPIAKQISDWAAIADALASLTAVLQNLKDQRSRKQYARLCNDFLTALLAKGKGMDLLEKSPREAANILKTVQVMTRYVQRIINDAKAKKDVSMIALIPLMRRNFDKLIMRVKVMCAACPEAFSSGNLRNRNLAGDEIFTQEMEDFDTPVFENIDSDMDDDLAENSENDDDATHSDISTTI